MLDAGDPRPRSLKSSPLAPAAASFQPSATFAGAREGFIFRIGAEGTGYYPGRPPAAVPIKRILELQGDEQPSGSVGSSPEHSPKYVRGGGESTTAALHALVKNAPRGGGGMGLPMFRRGEF